MNEYGIELFGSDGRLIYSSNLKTLRVVKSGIVSPSILGWGITETITFPAMDEQPQLFVRLLGGYHLRIYDSVLVPPDTPGWPYPKWDVTEDIYLPYVGPFNKNSAGKYVSFSAGTYLYRTNVYRQQDNPRFGTWGLIPAFPYTVFK